MNSYAELQTTSNFSFLRGASHPEELVARAAEKKLRAIAITDRNTLAGVVRAHQAARETDIQLIVGARLDFTDAPSLLCLPMNRDAYGRLSQLITVGRRRAPKGECYLEVDDFIKQADDQIAISLANTQEPLQKLGTALPGRCYLAGQNLMTGRDQQRLATLAALAKETSIPFIATNDVHYHDATRRDVQDALTSVREHCIVEKAGYHLFANAERHIKSGDEMAGLFPHHPDAVAHTAEIAKRCTFSPDELVYEYPDDEAPPGISPQEHLESLTWKGAENRYPNGISDKVKKQLIHELTLIGELNYANYFLTVHDIVSFGETFEG